MNRKTQLKIVFPYMDNFREDRPRLCYEHIYGWLDGWGLFFDPSIAGRFETVPEWSSGKPAVANPNDFLVTLCSEASKEVSDCSNPGLFVQARGDSCINSLRERLETPLGTFYYPEDLPFRRIAGNSGKWNLAGFDPVRKDGDRIALGFEAFSSIYCYLTEAPEKRLLIAADLLADLLNLPGVDHFSDDLRLDCQSYGILRLMIQWTLNVFGKNPAGISRADTAYRKAVSAYLQHKEQEVRSALKEAFTELQHLRESCCAGGFDMLEFPHAGVLCEKQGFFELEWPEGARDILSNMLNYAEQHGWRPGLELGASCWQYLNQRYPEFVNRVKELAKSGKLELMNGTWSLPYAQISPLSLQYRQLEFGNAVFRKIFGFSPESYECQENSLTPQLPDLLRHFHYKRAVFVTQNHGFVPSDPAPVIDWRSPGGTGICAFTAANPKLANRGINYFYDLPLMLKEFGKPDCATTYWNMMDVVGEPLRYPVVRATAYAPVFGRFCRTSDLAVPETLPQRCYGPQDGHFSAGTFYNNETNVNALSHFERLLELCSRLRVRELSSAQPFPEKEEIILKTGKYEAHDSRVQGQRPGEFFSNRRVMASSPYSRNTLEEELLKLYHSADAMLEKDYRNRMTEKKLCSLFNASEVPLHFAELKHPQFFSGKGAVSFGNRSFVRGIFPAFETAKPVIAEMPLETKLPVHAGKWTVRLNGDQIVIQCGSRQTAFTVRDRKYGDLQCRNAKAFAGGGWLRAEFEFTRTAPRMESVFLALTGTEDSELLDVEIRYAAGYDFNSTDRWSDSLALSFLIGEQASLRAFAPNLHYVPEGEKIFSLYSMEADDLDLLNCGAGVYLKNGDRLDWLFHVADEHTPVRRMALAFGAAQPFLLSRAWQQGVDAAEGTVKLPEIPAGWSLECLTADGWLMSDLKTGAIAIK